MLYDNNLIEMSLRLNRSEPILRTIIKLPELEEDLEQETTYDKVETYQIVL